LRLPHPAQGGQLDIVSPLPADLAAVLQALRAPS
jgi:hypothetical protein